LSSTCAALSPYAITRTRACGPPRACASCATIPSDLSPFGPRSSGSAAGAAACATPGAATRTATTSGASRLRSRDGEICMATFSQLRSADASPLGGRFDNESTPPQMPYFGELARSALGVARQPVVRDRLPRRGVRDELAVRRPDAGVVVEGAEADGRD